MAQETKIEWFRHAAFSVTTPKGKVLLIDPWRTNPLNPEAKDGIGALAAVPKVDYILLTHGHRDHDLKAFLENMKSLSRLYRRTKALPSSLKKPKAGRIKRVRLEINSSDRNIKLYASSAFNRQNGSGNS